VFFTFPLSLLYAFNLLSSLFLSSTLFLQIRLIEAFKCPGKLWLGCDILLENVVAGNFVE